MADPLFEFKDELTGDTFSVFATHGRAFAAHITMVISDPMFGRHGTIMLMPEQVAQLRTALDQAEAALVERKRA